MNRRATVSADDGTITGHVPLTFHARRCAVGAAAAARQRHGQGAGASVPVAEMLDDGVHATLEDLARAKGVAPSYVSRILRLTLLAPEIVEAILDGRQPAELQLDDLLVGFPLEWMRGGSVCLNTVLALLSGFAAPFRLPPGLASPG